MDLLDLWDLLRDLIGFVEIGTTHNRLKFKNLTLIDLQTVLKFIFVNSKVK